MFNFLQKLFRRNDNGTWLKVSNLAVGAEIAVPSDDGEIMWDEIVSINAVGREQVWDVEVEGTHNFIGNEIFAHNTAFTVQQATGNVGIGTTSPYAKLSVVGQTVSEYFTATSTTASVFPSVSMTNATTTNLHITSLGTPAGTILAVDTNGMIIATTTSAGGVTSVTGTWPIISSGGVTPAISWGGLSTSTAAVIGNIPYFSGVNTFANVATSSLTIGLGLTGSNMGYLIGGSSPSLTIATSSLYTGTTGQFPYFSDTNTITATSSLFIATNGNVGIGTIDPGSSLTVNGVIESKTGGIKFPDGSIQSIANPWQTAGSIVYYNNGSVSVGGGNLTSIVAGSGAAGGAVSNYTSIGVQAGYSMGPTGSYGNNTLYGVKAIPNIYEDTGTGSNIVYGIYSSPSISAESSGDIAYGIYSNPSGSGSGNPTIYSGIFMGGNVGIGTTSPFAQLSIQATAGGATPLFVVASSTNGAATSTYMSISNNGILSLANALTIANGGTGTTTAPSSQLIYGGGNGTYQSVATTSVTCSGTVSCTGFNILGTSPITITGSGSGGIGTVSTTSQEVSGQLAAWGTTNGYPAQLYSVATSSLTIGLGLTGSNMGYLIGGSSPSLTIATSSLYTGTTGQFPYFSDTNTITATSSLFLATSGNVGIGTTTPEGKLHIEGSAFPVLKVVRTTTDANSGLATALYEMETTADMVDGAGAVVGFAIKDSAGVSNEIGFFGAIRDGADNSGRLEFRSYNLGSQVTAMVIKPSGNIGMGTTSPFAKLSLQATAGGTTPLFVISSSTAGAATSTAFLITNNGNVGIGITGPESALNIGNGFINIDRDNATGVIARRYNGTITSKTKVLQGEEVAYFVGSAYQETTSAFQNIVDIRFVADEDQTSTTGGSYMIFRTTPIGSITRAERMRITSAGNLGIGTTSPYARLSLHAGATDTYNPTLFSVASSTSAYATSTLFTVLANGNVGIGTTSPAQALDVAGYAAFGGAGKGRLTIDNSYYNNNVTISNIAGSSDGHIYIKPASGGTTYVAPINVNNVFQLETTGTASIQRFHGYPSAANADLIFSTGNYGNTYGGNIKMMPGLSQNGYVTRFGNFSVVLSPSGTGSVQMLTNKVGIGTSTPWASLDIGIHNGGTAPLLLIASSSPSVATSTLFVINSQGNVGIGTTSPATLLEVGGTTSNITLDGYLNCTIFTTNANGLLDCTRSDERVKQNIISLDASNSLSSIIALNPVSFNWMDSSMGTGQQFGLIAQQVQNVFPNLVQKTNPTIFTPDGTLVVNYYGLIPPIISAIKELNLNINTIASTTASSTPESSLFATSFFNNIYAHLVVWFADASNGITDFFANRVHTQELCLTDGSGGETCVTKEGLDALLSGAGVAGVSSASPTTSSSGDTTSVPAGDSDETVDTVPDASTTTILTSSPIEPPISTDTSAPVVTLTGEAAVQINVGDTFTDPGATATDDIDGDLTSKIVETGAVDTSTAGLYTLTYSATDSAGNTGEVSRVVAVVVTEAAPSPDTTTTP